jgi:3-methyladenine DNA glycosylase/8-oxoguanine DNA glycosylase
MLGLAWDPAPFERRLRERPELERLVEGRRGLRVPLTPTVWECVVWAVVGQQVNLAFAYALRRDLALLAGEDTGNGLRAHPTADAVAALDYGDLAALRFSRRKAEYVVDAARAVVAGELPLESLPARTATTAERVLRGVRGFGPWSARYVLMRGCGFADCVPVGDAGLVVALQRFFDLPERPGVAETEAAMEPFAPFRTLATHHLWLTLGDPA